MPSKLTVADNVRNLANMFQSVLDAADAIEEIGKNEQIAAECQAAADAARKQLVDLQAKIAAAQSELAAAKDSFKNESDMRSALARQADEKAAFEAQDIVARAATEAQDIVSKARSNADLIAAGAAEKYAAMNGEIAKAQDSYNSINAATAAKQQELDALNAKIEEVKTTLRNLVNV